MKKRSGANSADRCIQEPETAEGYRRIAGALAEEDARVLWDA